MKKLPIGGKRGEGKFMLIDDENYDQFKDHVWSLDSNGYAHRCYKLKSGVVHIWPHKMILGNRPKNKIIDHINRNKLDNRKENLRFCTYTQNRYNSTKRKDNNSGTTGIYWNKVDLSWYTKIIKQGRLMFYKQNKNIQVVIDARNKAMQKYF